MYGWQADPERVGLGESPDCISNSKELQLQGLRARVSDFALASLPRAEGSSMSQHSSLPCLDAGGRERTTDCSGTGSH